MKNIHRHFRIRSVIKNKDFLKMCVLCFLLIFLLCSCNKDEGNVINDTEVVKKSDNISEDITNLNLEEVVHNQDDDKIIIDGPHNSYIITY